MDCDDFRSMLESSRTDVWEFIDTAIAVASMDYGNELRTRRDSIVEKLYAGPAGAASRCRNCDGAPRAGGLARKEGGFVEKERFGGGKVFKGGSPAVSAPRSVERDEFEEDEDDDENGAGRGQDDVKYGGVDDEQVRI